MKAAGFFSSPHGNDPASPGFLSVLPALLQRSLFKHVMDPRFPGFWSPFAGRKVTLSGFAIFD